MNLFHAKVIERAGISTSIESITTVKEALAYLTRSGVSKNTTAIKSGLVFLDINMPGLSGWDFIELYNQLDDCYKNNTVIVMLTSSSNPDDRNRALANGNVVEFITKPLKSEVVIRLIERYFGSEDQSCSK